MNEQLLPQGVWPVMLTPFRLDRSIDWDGLACLTDYYVQSGAAGLFACAGSSEPFDLTDEEKLALVTAVVKQVDGRVVVVGGGLAVGPLEARADFVRRMAETGVDAVILAASLLADPEDDDAQWRRWLG